MLGRVYEDPVPALKRQVGAKLAQVVAGWKGDDIGSVLGTDRSRVADLRRGKLDRFSLETLIRFAYIMRCDVELSIERRRLFPRSAERKRTEEETDRGADRGVDRGVD